ncbi:MAG: ABC transporter permease [Myxococcota bacterium]
MKMLWSALGMALREIRRNAMRSFLTALGIVIGVAAVIAMVHLGAAATRSVTDQIASLGQNLMFVSPGNQRGPGGARSTAAAFTEADAQALAREVPGVKVAPATTGREVAVYGGQNWPTTITGSTPEFFDVRSWSVAEGRVFEPGEVRSAATVCVLGATVRRELFGARSPLGEQIRIGKLACRVIGLLASRQATMGMDQDDVVIMPLTTFQRRIAGNDDIGVINVSALEDGSTARVQHDIELLLRERRHLRPSVANDFEVRSMEEVTKTVQGTTAILTALLGAIAGVSLLVGGIGIMNIMLVSVTERTREIGIRLAIGARGREVLAQFLVESAALSILGGLIGIGLGLGGSLLATSQLGMPFTLVPSIVVVAFVFSAIVGIAFGWWPARKAARLDPIVALRHE